MEASDQRADPSVHVLLADDHVLIAEAVGSVLSAHDYFSVDTVENLSDALTALADEKRYHIIMLDIKMPGASGIDSIKRVVDAAKGAKVALFTAHADRQIVMRALKVGVRGIIPKTMPLQALDSVLRLIHSGELFVPSRLMQENEDVGPNELTQIELLVLSMAAEGLTNKRIAVDIGATEATIKMHMRAICKKLGASNRAHAAIIAQNNALIDV